MSGSEQRLYVTLHAAGMVAWEYNLQAGVISWSPNAAALFGLPEGSPDPTPEEAIAAIHPDDRAYALACVEHATSSGIYRSEFRLVRPDGSTIWVRDQGQVILDAAGAPHLLLGVTQDITELKATQEALRVSEERFRVALQGSPVVVFSQDKELHYTWIYNPALGYTTEQVLDKNDYDLFERREDAEVLIGLKRRVLTEERGLRQEVRLWSQGEHRYYDLTVEPLRNLEGQVAGVICAAVDISAHKHREEEVRQAHKLSEAALSRAQTATHERELLISIASHDLRTPLTVISAQAQLLQRSTTGPAAAERVQRASALIVEQSERLNRLIDTLLDLSRIQEGRLTIKPERVDLGALLAHTVEAVQSTAVAHRLTLNLQERELTVHADPLRIEQVFLNLLGNAVKYSPHGGLISVWAELETETVAIHISDQGIGIPETALRHLFNRFYRAPNATQYGSSSLGVGLFVVRELVFAHGGRIEVASAEGQGSIFTVRLPRNIYATMS